MKHTYLDMANAINKEWITVNEVQILSGRGRAKSYEIVNEIAREIQSEGKLLRKLKPMLIPTKRVLEHLELDENEIFRKAKRQKGLEG